MSVQHAILLLFFVVAPSVLADPNECCLYVNTTNHDEGLCGCFISCVDLPEYTLVGEVAGCANCFYPCDHISPSPSPPSPSPPFSPTPPPARCDSPFSQSSYTGESFDVETPSSTPMGIAFDGTNYWGVNGGSPDGFREGQFDQSGDLLAQFAPGFDFRSVFTQKDNAPVFCRNYASEDIYVQKSPGDWTKATTLSQSVNDQSSVVYDNVAQQLVGQDTGVVSRFDQEGNFVDTLNLVGYGDLGDETSYPQQYRMAWASNGPCNYYLTYSDGTLSAWDTATGVRLGNTTLAHGGTGLPPNFSFSYANGYVFVYDDNFGDEDAWKRFKVF